MGRKNISPLRSQQVYTIRGSAVNPVDNPVPTMGYDSFGNPIVFSAHLARDSPDHHYNSNPLLQSRRLFGDANTFYPNVPIIITPSNSDISQTKKKQSQSTSSKNRKNSRQSAPQTRDESVAIDQHSPDQLINDSNSPQEQLPVSERRSHDVFFALLFIGFIGFLCYICTNVALTGKSKPEILIHGYDNYGNLCGQSNPLISGVAESGKNMTSKPYLMVTFARNYSLRSSCVAQCPSNEFVLTIFNRCIPKSTHAPIRIPAMLIMEAFNLSRTVIESVVADTAVCWKEVLYSSSISFIISIFSLILLRFIASVVIWLSLIALFIASAMGTFIIWMKWLSYSEQLVSVSPSNPIHSEYSKLVEKWLTAAIVASLLLTLFTFLLIGLRKRIQLAASLIKEAGKCISSIPCLLLQPFCTCIIIVAVSIGWLAGLIYLQSARVPVVDDRSGFVSFQLPNAFKVYKWPMFFAILWLFHFIVACQHFVICSSVCQWYFSRSRNYLSSPIFTSYWILLRYHLGSVALGSLIVSGVKVIRLLFKRLEALTERSTASTYSICNSAGKVFQVFLWVFQKIIVYINTNTYVEIALTGKSFAQSARRAFVILTCNSLRVATVNSVGDFLIFLSKLLVVIITLWINVKLVEDRQSELNYIWSPMLVSGISAFFVSHCFLSIYEMAIDSLLLCYCEEQIALEKSGQTNELDQPRRKSSEAIAVIQPQSMRH